MKNTTKAAAAAGMLSIFTALPSFACLPVDSVYMGAICATAANFCPKDYAVANGAILSAASNQALFSLLGATYGGDGRTTFGLPDLRGRSVIGAGQGLGLSLVVLGEKRGVETVTETVATMANHTHLATSSGGGAVAVTLTAKQVSGVNSPEAGFMLGAGGAGPAGANIYVDPTTPGSTVELGGITTTGGGGEVTISHTGNSQPIINLPPQQGVTYCIATQGLYPPRN